MKFEKESKSFKMMEMKSPGPNKTRRRSMKTADGGTFSTKKDARCKESQQEL